MGAGRITAREKLSRMANMVMDDLLSLSDEEILIEAQHDDVATGRRALEQAKQALGVIRRLKK